MTTTKGLGMVASNVKWTHGITKTDKASYNSG